MTIQGNSRKIGRYTILSTIGRGGMATVYRAAMPASGKIVALKHLNPAEPLVDLLGMDKLQEIFITEAATMSRLDHSNIVKTGDIEYDDDSPYFSMEFYCNNIGRMIGEKFTLEEPSRIIRPAKAIDYVNQILDGLRYIHAAGIVHRDIKPQNILMTDHDTVKICDFGMALQAEGESFGSEGLIIGSPYYSAPEQSNDPSSADRRSDLYSTGVFMYRMLTGELPGMKSFMLSRVNPLYDKKWDIFFETILNWMPDNRYQSADEMTEALLQLKLNWKKKKQFLCRTHEDESVSDSSSHPSELRSLPIRESGQNAQNVFKVNQLWQPVTYTRNSFSQERSETVFDKETGLVWQRTGSDYPVDRDEADEIIAALNSANFGGFSSWRLPTVNELLTFLDDQAQSDNDCDDNPFSRSQNWLWSCDRRSEKTSWFVNLNIGYVDWQENGCRYFARAVCSDQSA